MLNMNHPDRGERNELLEDVELPALTKKKPKKPRPVLTLARADEIAAEAHEDQVDKAGAPYIGHPRAVAQRIADAGHDEEMQMAALLHDVPEDKLWDGVVDVAKTMRYLRKQGASARVLRILDVLTHRKGVTNEAYWEAISLMYDAVVIKDADIDENSDPERLAVLDSATQERLIKKYTDARVAIHTYYK